MVFPCKILLSLCNSLSTSNLSEIMKNVQGIQASQRIMSGGLIQIPIVKKACLANKNGALMHTFLYLSLLIIHFLICWPSDIPVGKHPNDNNIESNHQRSDIVEKHTSGD